MLIAFAALVAGLALLALGSDRFVLGAAGLARNVGVSPMVVGLTIVAMGTSAPEMLVSAMAAFQGNPGLALGNAVGSNIANTTLVVGAAALFVPLVVASQTLRREFPILFAVTALAWLLSADGALTRADAGALGLALVAVLALVVRTARLARADDPLIAEIEHEAPAPTTTRRAAVSTLVGLAVLLAGSKLVVVGAADIARAFGFSDLVIGLSVVAVGTSLPEVAASVASARSGEPDIAIGNVLGSNLFNLLAVLGIAGLVAPFEIESGALERDFPILAALSVVFLVMCIGRRGAGQVTRFEGGVMLALFVAYQGLLYTARA